MSGSYEELRRYMRMDVLAGLRIRRWEHELRKNFESVAQSQGRYLMYASNEAISDAVYRQDITFLEGIYNDCIGITKLKTTEAYKLLKDVEADNVDSVVEKLKTASPATYKDNSFFKFYGRDQRSYFLNPAHLARSPQMIATLATRDVDFKNPDSEGRLPLFFIARHAKSRWVMPVLCHIFKISANDSGALPKYIKPPAILADEENTDSLSPAHELKIKRLESTQEKVNQYMDGESPAVWDPPIIRALKYRNKEALLGFNMLPKGQVDWNIRFQWNHMTPLIYAVIRADEIVKSHQYWNDDARKKADIGDWQKLEYSQWEVAKALWMVKFLVSHPSVNPYAEDSTGMDAKGYAFTKSVQNALEEGLKVRKTQEKLFTTYPSRHFT